MTDLAMSLWKAALGVVGAIVGWLALTVIRRGERIGKLETRLEAVEDKVDSQISKEDVREVVQDVVDKHDTALDLRLKERDKRFAIEIEYAVTRGQTRRLPRPPDGLQ